ncbi:unnamed protein product [Boreogadus saida]
MDLDRGVEALAVALHQTIVCEALGAPVTKGLVSGDEGDSSVGRCCTGPRRYSSGARSALKSWPRVAQPRWFSLTVIAYAMSRAHNVCPGNSSKPRRCHYDSLGSSHQLQMPENAKDRGVAPIQNAPRVRQHMS